jgi:hypothetical protein
MSMKMNVGKAGVVLGTVMGIWHLSWSLLVAAGLAQALIDFVFWVHFIKPVYVIEPFDAARAAMLVVMTVGIGFVVGVVFAWVWNALHKA